MLILELAIVAALIVLNGLLAMSELAIVSSRPARLRAMVERNVIGSRRALALASDPGKFLSTVQIGITLVGVLSGAFSGATLGLRLADQLERFGLPDRIAEPVAVAAVVALITYASLIIGELVPKQIALHNPEGIAVRVAPAMTLLAKVASPVVRILDLSGKAALWLLGHRGESQGPGHRGGNQDVDRRSGKRRRARARREGDDRRRDAARRSAGARRDDAALGRRHDQPRRQPGSDPRRNREEPALPPAGA